MVITKKTPQNHLSKKYFLVLGGSSDSLKLIRTLKELNQLVLLIDKDKNCLGNELADSFICFSIWDHKNIIDKIKDLPIAISLTRSSGYASISCAKINNYLGLTKMTLNSVESLIDKEKIYQSKIKKIVSLPKQICFNSYKDISSKDLPIIIKPSLERVGKLTTYKVESLESIKDCFEKARKNSLTNKVVGQEYISGYDVSLIGYSMNEEYQYPVLMKEINQFETSGYINHDGFVLENNNSLEDELIKIANRIVKKFNINLSPLNLSFRIASNKIYLIEINLDFGGEGVLEYIESRLKINHISKFICSFLDSNHKSINI